MKAPGRRPARRGAQERGDPDQPDRALPRQSPPRPDGRRERAAGAVRHHADRRHDGRLEPRRRNRRASAPSQTQAPEARKVAAAAPARRRSGRGARAGRAAPEAAPSRQSAAEPLIAPTPTASLIAPTPVSAPASQPAAPRRRRHRLGQAAAEHRGACRAGGTACRAGFASSADKLPGRDRRAGAARRRGRRQSGRRIRDRRALFRRPRRDRQSGTRRAMVRARRQAGPRAGALSPRQPVREGPGRQEGPEQGAPALSAWPPTRATPRRSTTSRCSMPRASTASPTTARRRNGSARRRCAASPTASTISASSTPAASASTRISPNPTSGSRLRPQQGDQDAGQEARRRGGAARPAVARRGAPRGADLRGRAAARRGHERQGAGRRLGSRHLRGARQAGRDRAPQAAVLLNGRHRPARPHHGGNRDRVHACGRIVVAPFTEPSSALARIFARDGRRIRLSCGSPPLWPSRALASADPVSCKSTFRSPNCPSTSC